MRQEKIKFGMKQWALILSVVCLLMAIAGGIYAFLFAETQPITNQFDPVVVTCAVEEAFDGNIKRDVCIRNTGDIDAFIRAAVVINWVGADGKVLSTVPVAGTDYTVAWCEDGWVQSSDGFWYYRNAVASGDVTAVLIRQIAPVNAPEGFSLQVQILATAIQADPPAAVENAWGVSANGNALTIN